MLTIAITQVLSVATGLQDSFSWKAVAVSGLVAPISQYAGAKAGEWAAAQGFGNWGQQMASSLASGVSGGLIRAATYNHGRIDWSAIAADSFGNAIGNSVVEGMRPESQGTFNGLRVSPDQVNAFGPRFASEQDADWRRTNYSLIDDGVALPRLNAGSASDNNPATPAEPVTYLVGSSDRGVEAIARSQYGDRWRTGMMAIIAANELRSNALGSPIIRVGDRLVVPDVSGLADADVAALNRLGGQLVANNSQGIAAWRAARDAESVVQSDARLAALAARTYGTSTASSAISATTSAATDDIGMSLLDPYGAWAEAGRPTGGMGWAAIKNAAQQFAVDRGTQYADGSFGRFAWGIGYTAAGVLMPESNTEAAVGLLAGPAIAKATSLVARYAPAVWGGFGVDVGAVATRWAAEAAESLVSRLGAREAGSLWNPMRALLPERLHVVPAGGRSFELAIANERDISSFPFGRYLRALIGDPPSGMLWPHAHHILPKQGFGETQQQLVREGQLLLRRYDIDPIFGIENLVWAPNRIAGQHDTAALRNVVDQLKSIEAFGGGRTDIVEELRRLGDLAARRR
jgi:hypothetical protein